MPFQAHLLREKRQDLTDDGREALDDLGLRGEKIAIFRAIIYEACIQNPSKFGKGASLPYFADTLFLRGTKGGLSHFSPSSSPIGFRYIGLRPKEDREGGKIGREGGDLTFRSQITLEELKEGLHSPVRILPHLLVHFHVEAVRHLVVLQKEKYA